jgi:hypothetical protein
MSIRMAKDGVSDANGKRRGANINEWASQETETFVGDVLLSQYNDLLRRPLGSAIGICEQLQALCD